MALPHLDLWFRDLADDSAGSLGGPGDDRSRPDGTGRAHQSVRTTQEEEALIARIRSSDEDAYVILYERYMQPLAQFALHLTGDPSIAEDVTAHVLAAVWLRRDRWVVREGIDAYLFGAIRNRIISLRHTAASHARIERTLAENDRSPTTGTLSVAPDAAFDEADWSERLSAAMQRLPDRYRQVAFLRWKRGLEYDQIALILSVSEGTARQLVSRTLRALRELLGA